MNEKDQKLLKELTDQVNALPTQIMKHHDALDKKDPDKEKIDYKAVNKEITGFDKKRRELKKQINEILKRNNLKQLK